MGIFRNLALLVAEGNQDYYFDLSFGDGVPISCIELEYLQSTGTQYINTGISPDNINTTVEIKYQYLNNLGTYNDSVMGSRSGSNINRFYPSSRNNTANDRMVLGNTELSSPYDIEVHTVLFNDTNHDCYLDGELVGNLGTNFTPHGQPMYLFALNNNGTKAYQSACRIYYCKIWKDGELISHLKPCQNADGTLCFFDVVRKQRLYNAGTGTFQFMHKAGTIPLPEGFTALDYITATGAQYIDVDTQLWANQNWIMQTTVALDRFEGDNQLLGTKNVSNTSYQTKITSKVYSYSFNNTSNSSLTILQPGVPITVTHDNTSTVLINKVGSTFTTATKSTSALAEDLIFGHRYGAPYFNGKIYNLALWKDGRPARNFIPCLNAEGEAGLFDSVNGVFYPSEGDLSFYSDTYEETPIPTDYIQVDYISSTGTQYINTGFYPTGDTRYDMKFTNCITNGVLFGAYNNTWTDGYGLYTNAGTKGYYYVHYNSNTQVNVTSEASGTILLDRGVARINNSVTTINSNVLDTSVMYPLYLLAGNMDGAVEQPVICDLYYFKIYTSEGLQRDFVPVIRKTDNKPGLYDKVSGEFFASASTTDFIAAPINDGGDEIELPQGYQQVEYIEATGSQYVNTNLIPNNNTDFEVTFSTTNALASSGSFGTIFGSRSTYQSNGYHLTTYTAYTTAGHFFYGSASNADNVRYEAGIYNSGIAQTISLHDHVLTTARGDNITLPTDASISSSNPILLFALKDNSFIGENLTGKIYACKFWKDGELVRDFVPAVRESDNVAGFYCLVTGMFYENGGSNELIPGPIVESSSMKNYVLDACDLLYDGIMSKPENGIWTNLVEGGPNISYGSSFTVGEKSLDLTCTSASSTAQKAQVMTTFPSNYTVEYTFRAHNHTSGVAGLVILNSNSSILYMHFTQDDFINLSGYIYNVGQGYDVDYVDGALYHVAFTYKPSQFLIYVNGVHVKTINYSMSYSSVTNMTVGPYRYNSSSIYPGGTQHSYYAVRRHTRVLTPEEIAQNAAEDLARYA